MYSKGTLLAIFILLTGCATTEPVPQPPLEISQPRIERLNTATRPTPIAIDAGASWLLGTVTNDRAPLPASVLIRALSPKPVHFSFKLVQDPILTLPRSKSTIREYLDDIAYQANWAYTANENGLTISDKETRYFEVSSLNLETTGSMVLRGLDTGEGGGASNKSTYSAPAHGDLVAMLATFGDRDGVSLSLSKEIGQLKAVAPPNVMREIAAMVEKHNRRAQRRVSLEFVVYSVDVTNNRERAVDITLLRNAVLAGGLAQPGAAILGSPMEMGTLSFVYDKSNARWDGSNAVLRWLNEQGRAEIKMRRSSEPVLNQLVTLENRRVTRYVSKVTRENTVSGSSETQLPTIETGKLTTGVAMSFLANIAGEHINIRLSFSQAEIVRMDSYSFDGGAIAGTLPISDDVNQIIPLTLRNGETRIITNLRRTESTTADAQTPLLPWVGDQTSGKERVVETVLLVSARMVD